MTGASVACSSLIGLRLQALSETEYRKTLLDALDANRVSIPIKDLEMQGKNQNYALLLNGAKRLDDIKNVASYDCAYTISGGNGGD